MGREATLYLTERGVRVVGTDGWSWDAPFNHTAKKWAENPDPSIVWEGHKAGREIPYWQMEKLHNLHSLLFELMHHYSQPLDLTTTTSIRHLKICKHSLCYRLHFCCHTHKRYLDSLGEIARCRSVRLKSQVSMIQVHSLNGTTLDSFQQIQDC